MEKMFYIYENMENEEGEKALVEKINDINIIVIKGDYYHDKITDKIDGFLMALNYIKEPYNIETKSISKDDIMFNELDFYCEDDEENDCEDNTINTYVTPKELDKKQMEEPIKQSIVNSQKISNEEPLLKFEYSSLLYGDRILYAKDFETAIAIAFNDSAEIAIIDDNGRRQVVYCDGEDIDINNELLENFGFFLNSTIDEKHLVLENLETHKYARVLDLVQALPELNEKTNVYKLMCK